MKKLLYWAMAALLVTGFTACNNEEPAPEPDPTPVTPDPEPEPEPEPTYTNIPVPAMTLGTVYFAPGWTPNDNYTAGINDGTISITCNDATSDQWQAQFPFELASTIALENGKTYRLSITLNASSEVNPTIKFEQDQDNFLTADRIGAFSGDKAFSVVVTMTKDVTLDTLLFDLGGNQAGLTFTASNITLEVQD